MQSLLKQNVGGMLVLAALITLSAPCGQTVLADTQTVAHVTRCDLFSHGITIGHGRIIRTPMIRDGKSCMKVRLIIESKVHLLLYKLDLKLDEVWVTDTSGLIAYTLESIENGQRKTITGELKNEIFQFEIMEAGKKSVWTTPRTAFDLASISQPEPTLAEGDTKKVRVLDPSTCTIAERSYRGTGRKSLTVGKHQIMCDTVTVECPGTHIRRWYIADKFGPLILREDGSQRLNTYSRCAVSVEQ